MVMKPTTAIVKLRAGALLEADQCASGLAAAEVITAALRHPCRGLPEEILQWLSKRDYSPGPTDVKLAREAVTRIAENSELKELREDTKSWTTGLTKLVERLERTPRPRKPKQRASATLKEAVKSTSTDAVTVELSEIRKIVKQRKGGLAIIGGRPDYLDFEGAIVRDRADLPSFILLFFVP